jgi:hypothetical protein
VSDVKTATADCQILSLFEHWSQRGRPASPYDMTGFDANTDPTTPIPSRRTPSRRRASLFILNRVMHDI